MERVEDVICAPGGGALSLSASALKLHAPGGLAHWTVKAEVDGMFSTSDIAIVIDSTRCAADLVCFSSAGDSVAGMRIGARWAFSGHC